jgi:hypothetical protein
LRKPKRNRLEICQYSVNGSHGSTLILELIQAPRAPNLRQPLTAQNLLGTGEKARGKTIELAQGHRQQVLPQRAQQLVKMAPALMII